jgi:UDP-N-acetylmuramoylalanine-D-glutamate ligase
MNYYKGDVQRYFEDKSHIFRFQETNGRCFATQQAKREIIKRLQQEVPKQHNINHTKFEFKKLIQKAQSIFAVDSNSKSSKTGSIIDVGGSSVNYLHIKQKDIQLVGSHNVINCQLASALCQTLGVPKRVIQQGLKTARAEAGRLEYCGLIKDIHVYDDNNATSPDAVIACIKGLKETHTSRGVSRNITLIMGGAEKHSQLEPLITCIKKEIRNGIKVLLLDGTGTQRFLDESGLSVVARNSNQNEPKDLPTVLNYSSARSNLVKKKVLNKVYLYDNFKKALMDGFNMTKKGDILVLSPGFSSFNMFINEYNRDDQFKSFLKTV